MRLNLSVSKIVGVNFEYTAILCYTSKFIEICCSISVFNDGSRKELVNLQGTIPVVYKGNLFFVLVFLFFE